MSGGLPDVRRTGRADDALNQASHRMRAANNTAVCAEPRAVPAANPYLRPSGRQLDPCRLGGHRDRLYRAALALTGSPERAEDLVQDTYVRVLTRPRFLRNDDELGYLLRVLRNTFISEHRRARARPALTTADEVERVAGPTAAEPEAVAEGRLVYEAIATLAPDFREALVAVDIVGLSYREAARTLRLKEATLTTRLFRARRRVAALLRPEQAPGEGFRPRPRPRSINPCTQ